MSKIFATEELVMKLNLQMIGFSKKTPIHGLGSSGTATIGEVVNARIKISGETTYLSTIKVVNSSQIPLLLGMDWLVSAQIVLDLKFSKLKEYLNGRETTLIGVGKHCLPTTNLFLEPLPSKPIYLGPEEVVTITLHFPSQQKIRFFRRDKNAITRVRLIRNPKSGKAMFSVKNSHCLSKIYLETSGKATEHICLGGASGIYARYGIRAYESARDHELDHSFGPDISRVCLPYSYSPTQYPLELVESSHFANERHRKVKQILKKGDANNFVKKLIDCISR